MTKQSKIHSVTKYHFQTKYSIIPIYFKENYVKLEKSKKFRRLFISKGNCILKKNVGVEPHYPPPDCPALRHISPKYGKLEVIFAWLLPIVVSYF